ncbi:MAG: tetratricopeptide repeat protein [Syntrophales bacterium]|nr:tetratricopeptide repeat protein [Syntrophales bacterium]
MNTITRFVTILLLICLLIPVTAKAETGKSAEEDFFEANRAYKNEAFQEAIDGYLRIIEHGSENGHIYYNLGNAYFRLGYLGKAILSYEKARLFIPRDSDLNFNLSQAKNQTRDDVSDSQNFSLCNVLGLDGVNLCETFLVFTLLNVLFFGILCVRIFKKAEWGYYLSIFLAIFIGIGALVFVSKWHELINDDRAVIISKEVEVLAGPDPEDTVLFKIHEGVVVHHERAEDGWVLLRLSKDKRGWVKSDQLERIVKLSG